MKLKLLPKIERPREKLIAKGPQNLKDKNPTNIVSLVGLTSIIVSYIIEISYIFNLKKRNYD